MSRHLICHLGLVLLVLGAAAARGQEVNEDVRRGSVLVSPWSGPLLVSPGGLGREGRVRTECPAFSWAAVDGASGYELVVYESGPEASRQPAGDPILRVRIPGGALSFTPEIDDCLAPGRYGWAVRAIMGSAEEGERPRWSRPALFRVETEGQAEKAEKAAPVLASGEERLPRAVLPSPAAGAPGGREADAGLRVLTGEAYSPPVCTVGGELFDDVPASNPYCSYIEQFARDGITVGCGAGNFCPDHPVSRQQLARFLERAMRGTTNWTPAQGANVVAPPADNRTLTVDASANVTGRDSSITVGADGLPIISYYDETANALKVAHCDDVACAGLDETITTVDEPANDVGRHTSITIGADGLPIIGYYDATAGALKVAHCNDVACAGQDETITTVDDPANSVGSDASIAIGADGLPIISYRDDTASALKVAHCNDVRCAGQNETITTVDDPANGVGHYTSIAIGADGLPIISHYDATAGALKVAHCNDVACAGQNETITTVDEPANSVGRDASITIGADGLPIIAYRDVTAGALKVAHCNDVACAGQNETITTVDAPANNVGLNTSITIGADGLPIVSYFDSTAGALKVTHCNDVACAGQNETITTVDDPANEVGRYSSMTIGADGLPIISYHDATAGNMKVAHCANVFCAPFFRRR